MPYYEIQYEPGRMSVACYDSDEEAQAALKAHNDRALNGELGGPEGTNWPAERIAAVYKYAKHPDEYNPEQTMSADVASKEVAALAKSLADENGVLNTQELAEGVAGLSHPFVTSREEPFASSYKMKADSELDLGFLSSEGGK